MSSEPLAYKLLKTTHPTYDPVLYEELSLMYVGGYKLLANAKKFIGQMIGESTPRYNERLKCASYIPYLSEVIDNFSSALFSQELTIHAASDADDPDTIGSVPDPEYYQSFARNADLKGTSFARLMRQVFPEALLKGKCLLGLDFPKKDAQFEVLTRADEEALGLDRAYAYHIPVEQLLDFEYNQFGSFAWCILHRSISDRSSPAKPRNTYYEEFKLWNRDSETGLVSWQLYRTGEFKIGQKIPDEQPIECVDEGVTSFKQIPIMELVLPDGLVVGTRIGALCKEHMNRRTALNSAQNKSLVAIPVVKLGSEIGSPGGILPSEAQQNINRGNDPVAKFNSMGFLVLGAGDSMEFVEPAGHAYKLIADSLIATRDELFRVVGQMAASTHNVSYSVGRSGASKQQDKKSTDILLTSYGAYARTFGLQIYNAISAARNEAIVWTASGLDSYDTSNHEDVVRESLQLDAVSIPSKTFKAHYKLRTALSLVPNLSHDTVELIRKEIIEGVAAEDDLRLIAMDHETKEMELDPGLQYQESSSTKQSEADSGIPDSND